MLPPRRRSPLSAGRLRTGGRPAPLLSGGASCDGQPRPAARASGPGRGVKRRRYPHPCSAIAVPTDDAVGLGRRNPRRSHPLPPRTAGGTTTPDVSVPAPAGSPKVSPKCPRTVRPSRRGASPPRAPRLGSGRRHRGAVREGDVIMIHRHRGTPRSRSHEGAGRPNGGGSCIGQDYADKSIPPTGGAEIPH